MTGILALGHPMVALAKASGNQPKATPDAKEDASHFICRRGSLTPARDVSDVGALFLLPAFLLTGLAEVAELAVQSIFAALGVPKSARLAQAQIMSSGANVQILTIYCARRPGPWRVRTVLEIIVSIVFRVLIRRGLLYVIPRRRLCRHEGSTIRIFRFFSRIVGGKPNLGAVEGGARAGDLRIIRLLAHGLRQEFPGLVLPRLRCDIWWPHDLVG
mmetsp:Transcript_103262/g.143857  ORF Transcript_103262/g.143857 Transcript_103262/m.143857 type:complete len:216 (-) Transcript_103262:620-1267(-)